MDFTFSEEQNLLQESVLRFIQQDYGFDQRQKLLAAEPGYSPKHWQQFADLGWLALPFAEEDGGFGGTAVETMILMEEFGKGLVIEPYLSSVILAGGTLARTGTVEQKTRWLEGVISGSAKGALAFVEHQARYNLADIVTRAEKKDGGYVLSGEKGVVIGGPDADFLIVPARTSGEQCDKEGVTLFLVNTDQSGVSRRDYPTIDGFQASEISFSEVALTANDILGDEGTGLPLLEEALDNGLLAICAEAVGAMEVLYKATVEYCKTREQFGQPIGSFQVLQHRMVDMFVEHEQSKSLLYMAAMRLSAGYDSAARQAVSALKVQVGKGGRFVGQNAIQLHGGMGMTDELNVGHYFKRLTAIDTMFGNVDYHLKRYAE